MVEQRSDCRPKIGSIATDKERLTEFGEPLWVDALKTLGVAMTTIFLAVAVGAVLGVMIIAPWGRASPDCSVYCVIEQRVEAIFSDDPS